MRKVTHVHMMYEKLYQNMFIVNKQIEKNPPITTECFFINVWESFTIRFGPKGPSSGNTYIQITEKIHWSMVGLYANEMICTINRFT